MPPHHVCIGGRKQIKERTFNIRFRMKSFLKKTWVLCLLVLLSPASSYAEIYSGFCGENIQWKLDTETGLLEIYNSQSGANSNMYGYYNDGGYNCAGSAPWFKYSTSIRSVNISGVNNIGSYAFAYCSNLTSITIPESVKSIDERAFYYCSSLASITIPESVTTIGSLAFKGCVGLTSVSLNSNAITSPTYSRVSNIGTLFGPQVKEYIIGDKIMSIGHYAFDSCSGLTSVIISGSVKSIGYYAFSDCRSLTSITIPESVTTLGHYAFENCKSLTSITIPQSLTSIGNCTFAGCSGLTSITIPESVTSIGDYAFVRCSGLTSITIPNNVTSIGRQAFGGCFSVENLTYAEGTTTILGTGLTSITSVTIPESVTIIGDSVFSGCSGLTSITIPENVMTLGHYAFENCSGLISITIPQSVTSIGNYSFSGCSGLTSITIPENVMTLGHYTFENCSGLTSITIPQSVTSIGSFSFFGCSGLTSITIPQSVTSIGSYAFNGCSSLTSVQLNSNAITSATYSSTNNLGTIFGGLVKVYTFGDEVKRIGEYAFAGCPRVSSIVLGRNIERIQDYAFGGCDKLEEVRVKNPEPPIAFSTAFTNNAYYAVLYVPEGSETQYKEDNVWRRFSRIRTFKDEPEKCVLAIKSAIGGYMEMMCNTQASYTFKLKTEKGWHVSSVSFNGTDVTANITDDSYTTPLLEGDSELRVIFEMDQDEIDMVSEVESHSQLSVTASASTIYIHNEGDPVTSYIYTTDGKMVKSVIASYGKTVIPLQPNNIYMVKAGTRTFKVAL